MILKIGRRRNGVESVFLEKDAVFCGWLFLSKKGPAEILGVTP
jgi:hypothetical protein